MKRLMYLRALNFILLQCIFLPCSACSEDIKEIGLKPGQPLKLINTKYQTIPGLIEVLENYDNSSSVKIQLKIWAMAIIK